WSLPILQTNRLRRRDLHSVAPDARGAVARSGHSLSARFVRDMASVYGSSTTGSNVALFQRRSENQMRHTSLESTTSPIDGCEIGSRTQVISTRHPQRKLYEVHYARCVGMPSGL